MICGPARRYGTIPAAILNSLPRQPSELHGNHVSVKEEAVHEFTRSIFLIVCSVAGLAIPAVAQDLGGGEFASLTGSEATFGIKSSNGVESANEEINKSGGLLGGRKIKIIVEDAIKERSWQSLCWSICTSKTWRFSRM
jgi:hypothetical protein